MLKRLLTAVAALVAVAGAAQACPNWGLQPHFGAIQLQAGFLPDPNVRNVTAGGTVDLRSCLNNTAGYVTSRPDFRLYYTGQSPQLTIAIQSPRADAVLLVNDAQGNWYFNDDYRGVDPAVTLYNPPQGQYDIWIGTYDGSRRNPAQLIFTEYNW